VKTNGSVYVAAVFAALVAYFVYQWWFNPHRIVKARLGDIAAAVSLPQHEQEIDRIARLARLRSWSTSDLRMKLGATGADITSRDAVLGAISALMPPPGGWNVDFVDADVRVDSDDTARAYVTADVTTKNPQTGRQTLDSHDVTLSFVKQDGVWLVREADVKK
jgi:SnoaL-like domain